MSNNGRRQTFMWYNHFMKLTNTFLEHYIEKLSSLLKGRYISHPDFVTEYSAFFHISSQKEQSLAIVFEVEPPIRSSRNIFPLKIKKGT